jgi:hypothetical protein
MALGRARSVPSATPERAHTTRKGTVSPAPRVAAQMNTTTASAIPHSQVRARPMRATSFTHNGMDRAAHRK